MPKGPRWPAVCIHSAHAASAMMSGPRQTAAAGITTARSGTATTSEQKMPKATTAASDHLYRIGAVRWHAGDDARLTAPKAPEASAATRSPVTSIFGCHAGSASPAPGSPDGSRFSATSSTKYTALATRPTRLNATRKTCSGRSHGARQLSSAVTSSAPWKPKRKTSENDIEIRRPSCACGARTSTGSVVKMGAAGAAWRRPEASVLDWPSMEARGRQLSIHWKFVRAVEHFRKALGQRFGAQTEVPSPTSLPSPLSLASQQFVALLNTSST